jgi:hypothetical protein
VGTRIGTGEEAASRIGVLNPLGSAGRNDDLDTQSITFTA